MHQAVPLVGCISAASERIVSCRNSQHFQVIWVCMLCRKKQELLSKTGQWINKAAEADGFMRPGGVSGFALHFLIFRN